MTQAAGTCRTRAGRCSLTGQYYHLITCTAGREPIFSDLYNARHVVASLMRLEQESIAETLAFVVMPDHLHWLMQLGERKTLSVCVGTMKSFAARRIARCGSRKGNIWQHGYMDRAIRREEDLVRVARYIVANPLRAGMVDDIGAYSLWDSVWMDNPA